MEFIAIDATQKGSNRLDFYLINTETKTVTNISKYFVAYLSAVKYTELSVKFNNVYSKTKNYYRNSINSMFNDNIDEKKEKIISDYNADFGNVNKVEIEKVKYILSLEHTYFN